MKPAILSPYSMVQLSLTPATGYGIFATKDIPRGTLIAVEAPLVEIPAGTDEESPVAFCISLQKLTEEDLVRLDNLSCDPATLDVVRNGDIRREIHNWYQDNIAMKNPELFSELYDIVALACQRYSIFLTNNLSMGVNNGRAVFDFFCRMNHSCRPSIYEHYDKASNRLSIRTLHDIKTGEEVYSTYIDVLMLRKRRIRKLKAWGFICLCSACSDDAMEALCERSIKLDDMLEEFFFYLDDPSIQTTDDDWPVLKSAKEALGAAEELASNLVRQGLTGEHLFIAYDNPNENANPACG
ncbi:hypothetical protein TruAng_008161 [Truncatella angustata]|nr:hypothetical protein TruAng_008161 [Truncatella angustata]